MKRSRILLPYAKVAAMGLPDDFQVATLQEQRGALERAYVRRKILRELFAGSRTLADESDTLDAFILKTAPGGANEEMTLGQFCGHGEGNNRINLTTVHSSKGREFRLVVMFGMDAGRIPCPNPSERETREARRVFYVGFTRAKEEIHIVCSANNPSPFVIEFADRLEE